LKFVKLRSSPVGWRTCATVERGPVVDFQSGDTKPVGGVSEMRIDYGPGYRVYFVHRGEALVILY
jgi:putative addiction module killer protein